MATTMPPSSPTLQLHGHEARQGKTVFAFLVLRFARPAPRDAVVAAIRHLASLTPDIDRALADLPAELDEPLKIVAVPWAPPEPGPDVLAQRGVVEGLASLGIDAAWFFQTGTRIGIDDEEAKIGRAHV